MERNIPSEHEDLGMISRKEDVDQAAGKPGIPILFKNELPGWLFLIS